MKIEREVERAVKSEMSRISQNLTRRIKTLAMRYAAPLPELAAGAEDLTAKVNAHLAKMGFAF
jgi:type I restriction enzyme M protein